MSPVRLNGSTSGYTELSAPAVAGNNSITLPTGNGSAYQIVRNSATAGSLEYADKLVLGTAQNSTSGTSIDFTGIPSWVKRITVMFNGVSTSGTSSVEVRLGTSGGVVATGYVSSRGGVAAGSGFNGSSTTGFFVGGGGAATLASGHLLLTNLSGNLWIGSGTLGEGTSAVSLNGGNVTLSGTLDRVRITTVNGTDTFDAGSINIMYE